MAVTRMPPIHQTAPASMFLFAISWLSADLFCCSAIGIGGCGKAAILCVRSSSIFFIQASHIDIIQLALPQAVHLAIRGHSFLRATRPPTAFGFLLPGGRTSREVERGVGLVAEAARRHS